MDRQDRHAARSGALAHEGARAVGAQDRDRQMGARARGADHAARADRVEHALAREARHERAAQPAVVEQEEVGIGDRHLVHLAALGVVRVRAGQDPQHVALVAGVEPAPQRRLHRAILVALDARDRLEGVAHPPVVASRAGIPDLAAVGALAGAVLGVDLDGRLADRVHVVPVCGHAEEQGPARIAARVGGGVRDRDVVVVRPDRLERVQRGPQQVRPAGVDRLVVVQRVVRLGCHAMVAEDDVAVPVALQAPVSDHDVGRAPLVADQGHERPAAPALGVVGGVGHVDRAAPGEVGEPFRVVGDAGEVEPLHVPAPGQRPGRVAESWAGAGRLSPDPHHGVGRVGRVDVQIAEAQRVGGLPAAEMVDGVTVLGAQGHLDAEEGEERLHVGFLRGSTGASAPPSSKGPWPSTRGRRRATRRGGRGGGGDAARPAAATGRRAAGTGRSPRRG